MSENTSSTVATGDDKLDDCSDDNASMSPPVDGVDGWEVVKVDWDGDASDNDDADSVCCTRRSATWLRKLARKRSRDERGFMGFTHALSAVAVILLWFVFFPGTFRDLFSSDNLTVLILLVLVVSGGALMPDLDNTQSSAKSALGPIGAALSAFMRTTSPMISTLIHGKYDKDVDNAHRGFYHTALCAVLMGALAAFLCSEAIHVTLGPIEVNGIFFALVLAFIAVDMALSVLAKPIMKKLKSAGGGILGGVLGIIVSLVLVLALFYFLPKDMDYMAVGIGYGVGWLIHDIGDCFTTAGVPLLFPLPIRGHLWWDIRFLKIKAGGVIENWVFIPLFTLTIIICTIIIITSYV